MGYKTKWSVTDWRGWGASDPVIGKVAKCLISLQYTTFDISGECCIHNVWFTELRPQWFVYQASFGGVPFPALVRMVIIFLLNQ
jgi:hypothetical protein